MGSIPLNSENGRRGAQLLSAILYRMQMVRAGECSHSDMIHVDFLADPLLGKADIFRPEQALQRGANRQIELLQAGSIYR